jgi:quaternary ammonium compound-resistance protein SugE
MAWLYLVAAAACEIAFAAVQTVPIGTTYAVWTGIGAAGTVIIGIVWFKVSASFWRLFLLVALVMSIGD